MVQVLHILTNHNDALASDVISIQREKADQSVKVFDLTDSEADYCVLLQEIFAADSIAVW
jgi:hypothetical protein